MLFKKNNKFKNQIKSKSCKILKKIKLNKNDKLY